MVEITGGCKVEILIKQILTSSIQRSKVVNIVNVVNVDWSVYCDSIVFGWCLEENKPVIPLGTAGEQC